MNTFLNTRSYVVAALLIAFGSITRYLLQDLPNIETITVVTMLAASLLGGPWGVFVGLMTVGITDVMIGNTTILWYTWSAWAVVGMIGLLSRYRGRAMKKEVIRITGTGLVGVLFFYAWTNFGVWHIGELYPHTWQGFVECYVLALPFLRNQLISTLLFVPSLSFVAFKLWNVYLGHTERAFEASGVHGAPIPVTLKNKI